MNVSSHKFRFSPFFIPVKSFESGSARKFIPAKFFIRRHPRKFIPAKCKYFAVFLNRESFFPRKFLPLKYLKNEDEKKKYNERVLQVENGTFTPLVFSTHGGMGRECKKFYQRLTEMISEKRDIPTSVATKYVRTRMSF